MNVFLRYGSHSEKEYFEKMLRFFDGVIFNSNLLEATPAATVSLITKYCGSQNPVKYIIDPMTYSFGEYTKPGTTQLIDDLSWLKSKTRKNGTQIKSSYRKLSKILGRKFNSAVVESSAIKLSDLENDESRKAICKSVIDYQRTRIRNILSEDSEFASLADGLPSPHLVFAPYFFIDEPRMSRWMTVYKKIVENSLEYSNNIYLQLCFDYKMLTTPTFIDMVLDLVQDDLKGICLWASNFDERKVDVEYLKAFKKLVEKLSSKNVEVFNRHGGYFSYTLSKFGMTNVSHSVGYGAQKDVMPFVGGGAPSINFYYPSLHGKYGVPKIERAFENLNISTSDDFYNKICACAICKGVIKNNLENFEDFGKTHLATPTSRRGSQTPAAAKRARFHFLLSKISEKKFVQDNDIKQLIEQLNKVSSISKLAVFEKEGDYIDKWIAALS